jgi:hypothetical protein
MRRALLWACVTVLLVLSTRWVVYALAPSPLASRLEGSVGGPGLVVVTLVSLGLAAAISGAALWLTVIGVRERHRLRPERELPRVRFRRVALRALSLSAAGSLSFALLESYVHWRAGVGFHGLSCMFGPVHRNALPVVAALSLLAAALAEVAEHLHAWLTAAVRELLRPRVALLDAGGRSVPRRHGLSPALARSGARPRAPPLPA